MLQDQESADEAMKRTAGIDAIILTTAALVDEVKEG